MAGKLKHFGRYAAFLLVLLILLSAAGCVDIGTLAPPQTDAPTVTGSVQAEPLPGGSCFEIYFLDVGQGDCALILCDGHAMLIDGGDSGQSNRVYSFLRDHGTDHLDYIVASHPDSDHIGGLAGALNYATVDAALCTVTEHDTKTFQSLLKYLDKQNVTLTVPDAGEKFSLGSAEVTVLGPEKGVSLTDNSSLILRVVYGQTSFLFTGDAELEDEKAVLETGMTVKSTVLKVGHHGSSSSTSYSFLYFVEPEYAVISVGADNSYGHPTEEVLSRLRDADVVTCRTDLQGTVHCVSDGRTVSFDTEKDAKPPVAVIDGPGGADDASSEEIAPSDGEVSYVVNMNTGKFHYPDCASVDKMKEENRLYFTGTREELIAEGYTPCGNCDP